MRPEKKTTPKQSAKARKLLAEVISRTGGTMAAAEYLGVTPRTIQLWMKKNDIPVNRLDWLEFKTIQLGTTPPPSD